MLKESMLNAFLCAFWFVFHLCSFAYVFQNACMSKM